MVWDLTNNCYQELPVQQVSSYPPPAYHQIYPCPWLTFLVASSWSLWTPCTQAPWCSTSARGQHPLSTGWLLKSSPGATSIPTPRSSTPAKILTSANKSWRRTLLRNQMQQSSTPKVKHCQRKEMAGRHILKMM